MHISHIDACSTNFPKVILNHYLIIRSKFHAAISLVFKTAKRYEASACCKSTSWPPTSTLLHFANATSSQTMVPPPVSSMLTFSFSARSPMAVVLPIATTTSSQAMAPRLRAAYDAPPRLPHITSTFPSENHQAGSGFRATPPHLRRSTSLTDPHIPNPACSAPSQQAPINIPTMPSLPNHT